MKLHRNNEKKHSFSILSITLTKGESVKIK